MSEAPPEFINYINNDDVNSIKRIKDLGYVMTLDAKPGLNYFLYACYMGKINTVKYLYNVNNYVLQSVDIRGNSPLILAAINPENHCFELVEFLIEVGGDYLLKKKNTSGLGILHLICLHNHAEFLEKLLAKNLGLNIHDKVNDFEKSPLDIADNEKIKQILNKRYTSTENEPVNKPPPTENPPIPISSNTLQRMTEQIIVIQPSESTINELESQIEKLKTEKNDLETEKNTLKTEMDSLQWKLGIYQNDHNEKEALESEKKNLETKIEQLENDIQNLRGSYETEKNTLKTEIQNLQVKLKSETIAHQNDKDIKESLLQDRHEMEISNRQFYWVLILIGAILVFNSVGLCFYVFK